MKKASVHFLVILTILCGGLFFPAHSIFAATAAGDDPIKVTNPPPGDDPLKLNNPPSSSNNKTYQLQNPLKATSIEGLFALIIKVLLIFAVPVIIFFIIYAGFLFVTARGNEEQIKKAKNALLWTLIGAAILLGANALIVIITNTVKSLTV